MWILDKMSMPGWEFKTEHIDQVFWMLDQCVCQGCKMTEEEYRNTGEADSDTEEGVNPYTMDEFKPETYSKWSSLEKVEWLLGTSCGCEFDFYNEVDGSNMRFAQIGVDSDA